MKVFCINNDYIISSTKLTKDGTGLTIGKWYEVLKYTYSGYNSGYLIRGDDNDIFWYDFERFITVDIIRNDKLNQLGII